MSVLAVLGSVSWLAPLRASRWSQMIASAANLDNIPPVTGFEIIQEIKRMPREERRKVLDYARGANNEQLSPDELEELTRQMVEETDPARKERLKAEIIRGFYGNEPHA